jgi:hypothetical protein
MTAPDHLKITGPEDVLGFIPHALGYWPDNSLVAVTVQGTRLGATLRIDLPEPARCRGTALAAFARTVRGYLEADGDADGTLLAVFSDTPWARRAPSGSGAGGSGRGASGRGASGGWRLPALDRLLRELEATLDQARLPVQDAWLVGERYWRNAHCVDPSCCPPPGRPIEEIRDSQLNAELVFRGSSVGAAPGTGARGVPPAAGRPAVLAAEAQWAEEFAGLWSDRTQFNAVLDVWERVLSAAADPASGRPAEMRPAKGGRGSGPPAAAGRGSARRAGDGSPGMRSASAGRTAESRGAASTRGPSVAARPAGGLSDSLAGYLRATLCVAAWRDAVLVMAAAGRPAALAGAEEFGLFLGGPGNSAPLPELDGLPLICATERIPETATGRKPRDFMDPVAADDDAADDVAADHDAAVPGYGDVLLGMEPPTPDWARLAGLDRVLLGLNDCGVGEARAAGLTARGWIEWCRGRGSFADALFTAAVEEQPGYRLAELLAELGRRGTLCGWASRKHSAWQKFDPDAA